MEARSENLIDSARLLLDGVEDSIHGKEVSINLPNNDEIKFKISYSDKSLLSLGVKDHIVSTCDLIITTDPFPGVEDKQGLECYFQVLDLSKRKYLIVYSFGEFQPGCYQLYLIGVWEVR